MAGLKKYRLVRAQGLRAVSLDGVDYPLATLTDEQAARLYGRTHVLEKVEQPALVAKPPRKVKPKPAAN